MYLKKINLKNKYALVTGAGKGLGRACSIAMAEAGATIIGLSRTSSDLDKLEKDIKKVKSKLIKINCDVMDYKDLSNKLKKITKRVFKRKYNIQRIDGLPKKKVTIPLFIALTGAPFFFAKSNP